MTRIYCPKCGRILGDTDNDFSGNMNCKNCKRTRVTVHQLKQPDYLGGSEATDAGEN